jgi:hypothetical protein
MVHLHIGRQRMLANICMQCDYVSSIVFYASFFSKWLQYHTFLANNPFIIWHLSFYGHHLKATTPVVFQQIDRPLHLNPELFVGQRGKLRSNNGVFSRSYLTHYWWDTCLINMDLRWARGLQNVLKPRQWGFSSTSPKCSNWTWLSSSETQIPRPPWPPGVYETSPLVCEDEISFGYDVNGPFLLHKIWNLHNKAIRVSSKDAQTHGGLPMLRQGQSHFWRANMDMQKYQFDLISHRWYRYSKCWGIC